VLADGADEAAGDVGEAAAAAAAAAAGGGVSVDASKKHTGPGRKRKAAA
jgi:hypothetical protein